VPTVGAEGHVDSMELKARSLVPADHDHVAVTVTVGVGVAVTDQLHDTARPFAQSWDRIQS